MIYVCVYLCVILYLYAFLKFDNIQLVKLETECYTLESPLPYCWATVGKTL